VPTGFGPWPSTQAIGGKARTSREKSGNRRKPVWHAPAAKPGKERPRSGTALVQSPAKPGQKRQQRAPPLYRRWQAHPAEPGKARSQAAKKGHVVRRRLARARPLFRERQRSRGVWHVDISSSSRAGWCAILSATHGAKRRGLFQQRREAHPGTRSPMPATVAVCDAVRVALIPSTC
jgi:hypothetical protein